MWAMPWAYGLAGPAATSASSRSAALIASTERSIIASAITRALEARSVLARGGDPASTCSASSRASAGRAENTVTWAAIESISGAYRSGSSSRAAAERLQGEVGTAIGERSQADLVEAHLQPVVVRA